MNANVIIANRGCEALSLVFTGYGEHSPLRVFNEFTGRWAVRDSRGFYLLTDSGFTSMRRR